MAPGTTNISTITFSAAERIKQLNDVDKDIVGLLRTAGQAVKALAGSLPLSEGSPSSSESLQKHKEVFKGAVSSYFSLLDSINAQTRRQIYALEEADIIPADVATTTGSVMPAALAAMSGAAATGEPGGIEAKDPSVCLASLGNLDVGWLNSRGNAVENDMEAEIWSKIRKVLEDTPQEIPSVEIDMEETSMQASNFT
ncbi:MAG: hypothetical protein M1829_005314 [Trizodia sp. TS-e1964]|nr:MAG: hypothetical protein M1829_005314 [Trizodia sp. TS-e1964]